MQVLTFEDLKQWLSEEQIEIEACEEEPFPMRIVDRARTCVIRSAADCSRR